MKIKHILSLLFLVHSCLSIPPFLKELGAGPLAALGVIANICGDEPAVACTCRNKDADDASEEEENDLDSVELVTGIPACIPDECICSDGTTQTLPKIPERIQNALSTAIEKIASKALSKMAKFCENDEEPEICECRNAILGEIRFPLENNLDIAKCKPSRCKCPGSEDWIHVHPGKMIFNRLINRVCNPDATFDLDLESEGAPTKCTCQDDSELSAPFDIKSMKKCNPKSCTCGNEEVDVNFNEIKEKAKFFKRRINKFNKICPNEQPPASCQCNSESEKGKSIEPPFDNVLEILDCLPQSCTCESGEIVTTERNKAFDRFTKLCGSNETIEMPTECACEDGSTMNPTELLESEVGQANTIRKIRKARKNVKKAFKTCRPTSCTCENGEENVITMFGCSNGGVPKCENGKKKLFCSGGEKINPLKAALAQSNGKCVCEDQMAPKCKDGKNPTCPNGEEIDFSLDQVPDMLAHCIKATK